MSLGIGIIASQRNKLLLDQYAGAAAAYSLRKLRSGYTGSAIRVRRSSDNTEQDIGFTSAGNLDESALTTFVGANDGFVVTWYDQSTNGFNLTQSTADNQPIIVSSGNIVSVSGIKTIHFNGTAKNLTATFNGVLNATHFHLFYNNQASVALQGNSNTRWLIAFLDGSNANGLASNAGTPSLYRNTTLITATTQNNLYDAFVDSWSIATVINANTSTWTGINLDLIGTAAYSSVTYRSELIIYNSDKSSDRTAIESNINAYYSIY
jgi:hypothetical protein